MDQLPKRDPGGTPYTQFFSVWEISSDGNVLPGQRGLYIHPDGEASIRHPTQGLCGVYKGIKEVRVEGPYVTLDMGYTRGGHPFVFRFTTVRHPERVKAKKKTR